jgi:hypothetical protein
LIAVFGKLFCGARPGSASAGFGMGYIGPKSPFFLLPAEAVLLSSQAGSTTAYHLRWLIAVVQKELKAFDQEGNGELKSTPPRPQNMNKLGFKLKGQWNSILSNWPELVVHLGVLVVHL